MDCYGYAPATSALGILGSFPGGTTIVKDGEVIDDDKTKMQKDPVMKEK